MRIKFLFFIVMLSISSVMVYAQTAETFRQPYPLGDKLSPNPNFTGEVWLAPLSEKKELNVPMSNVTFEPGCRNSWHSHKAGQLLIATAGIGYYQEKGQPARRLFPGDIVEIAPDVEHWHGAAPDSWFAHIAITTNPQNNAAPRSLRAIQIFMQVVDERKANGINDTVGREASAITDNRSRYERGRDVLTEISGVPADAPKAGYAVFAPTIERFLKEHLFADIFERDLLTYRERELATVSILAGVGGVEPMFRSHATICLHLGLTAGQLSALLNIVEMNLGKASAEPLRDVLESLMISKSNI